MKLNKKIAAIVSSALLVSALSISSFAGTYSCDKKAEQKACTTTTCVEDTKTCTANTGNILNFLLNFKNNTNTGCGSATIRNLITSLFNR